MNFNKINRRLHISEVENVLQGRVPRWALPSVSPNEIGVDPVETPQSSYSLWMKALKFIKA
jgi:hypothetical protein